MEPGFALLKTLILSIEEIDMNDEKYSLVQWSDSDK